MVKFSTRLGAGDKVLSVHVNERLGGAYGIEEVFQITYDCKRQKNFVNNS